MESTQPLPSTRRRTTIWSLSIILAAAFIFSGIAMIAGQLDEVVHVKLGVPLWALPIIGSIKVVSAIALLVPAGRFYGASVLTGTMAGAVFTHLIAGDAIGAPSALVLGVLSATLAWLTRPAGVKELLSRVVRSPSQ